jgi:catechol 2,3-dioxygenase-like lactoylglutathione lyase family enzyme
LVVSNREASVDWYGRVLGFEVVRDEVHAGLRFADGDELLYTCTSLFHFRAQIFLGIAQPAVATRPFRGDQAGLQHLGLHVDSREDLDAWIVRLAELGVQHSELLEEGPGLLVRFHDPDGIPVEVFWADMDEVRKRARTLARQRARARGQRKALAKVDPA